MSYPSQTIGRCFVIESLMLLSLPLSAAAASPTASQALGLTPTQPRVDYDRVREADRAKRTIQPQKDADGIGWVVRDPKGVVLRVFVDTNGDQKLDLWRYFKGGQEVYRDIDANFNGKADAYRWFGAGGERWGLDPNEDGTVDSWKQIAKERPAAEPKSLVQPSFADPPKTVAAPKEEAFQRLMGELEKLEKAFSSANQPEEQARLTSQKADLLEQIAEQAANAEERSNWLRQLTDMVGFAIQSGGYPEGDKRLEALVKRLRANRQDGDLVAYIRYQQLNSDYIQTVQAPKADYAKVQTAWIGTLEKYVEEYGTSPTSAEAMFQLAMTHEFSGQEDKAKAWYTRVAREFSSSAAGKRAAGAVTRLDCIGKEIAFGGQDLSGREVRLDQYRGKVVLLHYWATWSEFCKKDIAILKELAAKYDTSVLQILSVSVDHRREDATEYVKQSRLAWPQVFEEGGLDGRAASDLGIVNVPTMLLIDKGGKVVNRDVRVSELAKELERLK